MSTSSLFGFLPRFYRPQTADLSGAVLWGAAAVTGVLYVIQPFSWIKDQLTAPPAEEEEKK